VPDICFSGQGLTHLKQRQVSSHDLNNFACQKARSKTSKTSAGPLKGTTQYAHDQIPAAASAPYIHVMAQQLRYSSQQSPRWC
jgi:hypothetical protein